MKKLKPFIFKGLKWTGKILLTLFLLLVVLILALRLPFVQKFITTRALSYYSNKISTPATLGGLYLDFPTNLVVRDLYLEDQQADTLVYLDRVTVSTNILGLLNNRLTIESVQIENLRGNVYSKPGGEFNYQYIADAFGSPDPEPSSDGFDIVIGDVTISNSSVSYSDASIGLDIDAKIGNLEVSAETFDLDSNFIAIDYLSIQNTNAYLRLYEESKKQAVANQEPSDNTEPFLIDGDYAELLNVSFQMEDETSGLTLTSEVEALQVDIDTLDINRQIYLARKINIVKPSVTIEQYAVPETPDSLSIDKGESIELIAGSVTTQLTEGKFRFWDQATEKREGFDPAHMWFGDINLQTNKVRFENGNVEAGINSASATDLHSNQALRKLQGEFAYSDTATYARDFQIAFANSSINGDVNAWYASLEALTGLSENLSFDIHIKQASLFPQDLAYFQPSLTRQLNEEELQSTLSASLKVEGTMGNMTTKNVELDWRQNHLELSEANLVHVMNFPASAFSVTGASITTSRSSLSPFLPDSLSAEFSIPEDIRLEFDGRYRKDSATLAAHLVTSDGDVEIRGSGKMDTDSVLNYMLNVAVSEVNVGKIIQMEELGMVSLTSTINGRGLDQEQLSAVVDLTIQKAEYRDYTYRGLETSGEVTGKSFDGTIGYSDENLKFDFDGYLTLPGDSSVEQFKLTVGRADFAALNLADGEFRLIGEAELDVKLLPENDLIGSVLIRNLGVNRDGIRYDFDTLTMDADKIGEMRKVQLNSGFLDAMIETSFPIAKLPDVVNSYVTEYLSERSPGNDTTLLDTSSDSFEFNLVLKDAGFLSEVLLPELEFIQMQPVSGVFDGATSTLQLNIQVDSLNYAGLSLESLDLNVLGDMDRLTGKVKLGSFRSGPLLMENFTLDANSAGDELDLVIRVRDAQDSIRYKAAAIVYRDDALSDTYQIQIHPDSVLLNYAKWELPNSNKVTIAPEYLWLSNFSISKNKQQLSLNSELNNQGDSLLVLAASGFELSELASLAHDTIPTLSGVVNGDVGLNTGKSTFGLNADLNIEELMIRGYSIGKVELNSSQLSEDTYEVDLSIKGPANDVDFSGSYNQDGALTASMKINQLSLEPLTPLSSNNLTDVDGMVTGDFSVSGTVNEPLINGGLNFNEVSFKAKALNSKFLLSQERLTVSNNEFIFKDFTLSDNEGKTARINGEITTEDFYEYDLDLKIITDSFTLLDSEKDDNSLIYGKVSATSELDISGTNLLPNVSLDLTLSNDSKITYVIPESTISEQVQSDVVVFVDKDAQNTKFLGKTGSRDSIRTGMKGIRLDAAINVPSSAALTIVVDPITGDALTVKGEALLNFSIRPSGDITLTGRYEVKEGSYHMDFHGIVQRDFKIQEGSFILWTGNIYEAILNVTAVYEARAKPVQTQNTERLDFQVQLLLNGKILKPEISFKIDLAEGSPAPIEVQSWIAQLNQDEAQLNKQAFGLLIFNSFFDDTGSSGNWYDNLASNTARSSVSSFLSAELNKLSDKIQGVELTFDIDSYEDYNSQGQNIGRTQLELGLSKQLFDDRVIVKFAGNFDLEGKSAYRNNVSDFSGDIRIEYLLTEDGRYRLVGFRETNYDDLLQGEIIKTGGGFIFVRDYDSLRELFKKSSKKE